MGGLTVLNMFDSKDAVLYWPLLTCVMAAM